MEPDRTSALIDSPVAQNLARRALVALCERFVGDPLTITEGPDVFRFGPEIPKRDALAAQVRVDDARAWPLILTRGSAGLGEAWARRWWDADDPTAALRIMARAVRRTDSTRSVIQRGLAPLTDPVRRLRRSDRERDRRNIHAHYDLGNEFFASFLDPTMMYSCGIFPHPDASLEQASIEKIDRMCRLVDLRPDDRLVEIGTGWGGFALHAAREYGARVTTTTISAEQFRFATERVRDAGLSDRITVLERDYRDLEGTWDKLVSIEMIEAVDWRDHDTFFRTCCRLLRPEGLMGLQAIVIENQRFERAKNTRDFIKTHIFPGGCLPSIDSISRSTGKVTDLSIVELDDHGLHYAETLRRWRQNLSHTAAQQDRLGLDDHFLRLWEFYLRYCEAGFEERTISLVQMALARPQWRPESPTVQG